MVDVSQAKAGINILDVFKRSFLLFKENFLLFMGIALIGNVFGVLGAVLSPISKAAGDLIGFLSLPLGIFLSIWSSAALIIAVANILSGTKISLRECFAGVRGKYWRCVSVSLLYFLIFFVGFLLFVLPGVYWGTIFAFSVTIVVLEKNKNINPLSASKKLVKGAFWKVFTVGLISTVFSIPIYLIAVKLSGLNQNLSAIAIQIYIIIYLAFTLTVQVVLYNKLKAVKGEGIFDNLKECKKASGCLGCLVAFGLMALIIIMIAVGIFGLNRFVSTEKGAQVLESFNKRFSAKIVFPGEVSLQRPEGAFAFKREQPNLSYKIFISNRDKSKSATFELHMFNSGDLNLNADGLNIADEAIAEQIIYEIYGKSETVKQAWQRRYGVFKPASLKAVNIGGRAWAEYILDARKEFPSGKVSGYRWKVYYTPVGDNILAASFGNQYWVDSLSEAYVPDDEALAFYEVVERQLAAINFPE